MEIVAGRGGFCFGGGCGRGADAWSSWSRGAGAAGSFFREESVRVECRGGRRIISPPIQRRAGTRVQQFLRGGAGALGKYELVAEPREAELVFELELVGPAGPANPNKVKGASDPLPMFRLRIIDRETHYVLWVLTEEIAQANLQKTHDRNFDDALAALVGDLKKLTDKTAAGPA
jgi:hypothetical protein